MCNLINEWVFSLRWVSVAARGLSLVAASRGSSPAAVHGFSWWWILSVQSVGSRAWVQQSRCTGLVAPRHVESFWTRNPSGVRCIGRRILSPWTTREALVFSSPLAMLPGVPDPSFPDQGLDLCPLHWKLGVLTTVPPEKSHLSFFFLMARDSVLDNCSKQAVCSRGGQMCAA